jgi:hypothetical protein
MKVWLERHYVKPCCMDTMSSAQKDKVAIAMTHQQNDNSDQKKVSRIAA